MGLFTELRRSITRLWGRTEQAVGEAYGNQALEYEGAADEAKADAEETPDGTSAGTAGGGRGSGRRPGGRRADRPHDDTDDDDGTAAAPVH